MKYSNIPQEIKELRQWVCAWKNSKIPMRANTMKGASSSNPETWCSYETAEQSVNTGRYDNLGFVFNDNGIVGIDIDCGFDNDGFLSNVSIDIINKCKSYTERSRSGRGVHILVKGDLPFCGKNNGAGVEIYKSKRYFIVTGDKLVYGDITENQAAIDYIVQKYFPETIKASDNLGNPKIYNYTYTRPENGKISLSPIYPPIPDGMRNISLTSLAGQLHTQGYTPKDIYQELLTVNKIACKPPLDIWEIETIVNSICRYAR